MEFPKPISFIPPPSLLFETFFESYMILLLQSRSLGALLFIQGDFSFSHLTHFELILLLRYQGVTLYTSLP